MYFDAMIAETAAIIISLMLPRRAAALRRQMMPRLRFHALRLPLRRRPPSLF